MRYFDTYFFYRCCLNELKYTKIENMESGLQAHDAYTIFEDVVNILYILDAAITFFSLPINVALSDLFGEKMTLVGLTGKSRLLDVIVACICFGEGLSNVGLWFQVLRIILITISVIELIPQAEALLVSIISFND